MRISHSLSSSRGGEGAVALVRGVGLAIGASWAGGQGGWWAGLGRCPRSGAVSAAWRAGWSGPLCRAGGQAAQPLPHSARLNLARPKRASPGRQRDSAPALSASAAHRASEWACPAWRPSPPAPSISPPSRI